MKLLLLNTALSCLLQPGYHLRNTRRHPRNTSVNEAGLTLLECVVAIAVIALTGAMIGPPLVMAAATRVQNRRAEQALQLAQGEVDRVRAMVVRGQVPEAAADGVTLIDLLPKTSTERDLQNQGAPSTKSGQLRSPATDCNTYDATKTAHIPTLAQALPVDVDGDCTMDFMIQTFRYPLESDAGRDFQMMVRVYSTRASEHFGNLEVDEASLSFTTGQGNYWQKPLAVLTTRVNQSDSNVALCGYHGLNSANEDGEDDGPC